MAEVGSGHYAGGKTSFPKVPKITTPGVISARPQHPLHGPNTAAPSPHTWSVTNNTVEKAQLRKQLGYNI